MKLSKVGKRSRRGLAVCLVLAAITLAENDPVIKAAPLETVTAEFAWKQAVLSDRESAVAQARQLPVIGNDLAVDQILQTTDGWELAFVGKDRSAEGNVLQVVRIKLAGKDGSILEISADWTDSDYIRSDSAEAQALEEVKARDIAQAFLNSFRWGAKLNWQVDPYPESAMETRFNDRSLRKIRFNRMLNGIPCVNQQASIYVDNTGKVTHYQIDWAAFDAADPAQIIPRETAEAKLFDNVVPMLNYHTQTNAMILAYSMNRVAASVDGITGQLYGSNRYPDSGKLKPLTDDEKTSYISPSANVNAAKERAVAFILEKMPQVASQLAESPDYLDAPADLWSPWYGFTFVRIAGGIAVDQGQVSVNVSGYDGSITDFYDYGLHVDISEPSVPVITADQAKRMLLPLYDVQLGYESVFEEKKLKPVYRMIPKLSTPLFFTGQPPMVDAVSGQWLNAIGQVLEVPVPQDPSWVDEVLSAPERIDYPAAVVVDGRVLDQQALIRQDVTLVPMRKLFEELGATVDWNGENQRITAVKGDTQVILQIGSTTAYINGQPLPLEVPAQLIGESAFVPLRLAAEALGTHVEWVDHSRLAIITTNVEAHPTEDELKQWRMMAERQWQLRK